MKWSVHTEQLLSLWFIRLFKNITQVVVRAGLLGLGPPPVPVKSMDFMGFLVPKPTPGKKKIKPPWTDS